MNRKQFMEELRQLLTGISEEERVEALQYYEDYFDDAGAENEQQVIEELGTPQKVASTICLNLEPGSEQNGEFTESGFQDERFEEKATPAARSSRTKEGDTYSYNEAFGEQDYHSSYDNMGQGQKPWTSKTLKIILIIAIILVGAPVVIPVGIGIVAAVLGLVIAAYAVFAGLVVASVGIGIAGITVAVLGIVAAVGFPSAIIMIGVGLILLAIGLVATAATVRLCIVMYPAIFRIFVNICRWPFYRGKAVGSV